ncbi:hypothetical protein ABC795_03205 [Blastococcus sp. HT6-30]|uniref:hypothetical protein n=1 Tax=Blastococcus sp. HT6-30 TaxID=3144843 RepID=UPI00321B017B
MRARYPARARFLGLWTAGWLAALLVAGMVRFGDPAVQWPVLLVPAVWALVALRPRRPARGPVHSRRHEDRWADEEEWADERYEDGPYDEAWDKGAWDGDDRRWPPPGERTDTVERPALRPRSDGTGERW